MKGTNRIRGFVSFLLLAFCLGLIPHALNGQYFGRNKVLYKNFDFKILRTEHFDVYFYPEFYQAAEQAARMAERWYARLSRILNHNLRGRQPLILYASSPHFQQTSTIPEILGEGTGGLTEMLKRRIVLPLGASLGETDHVIGHELVHAFQFDLSTQDYQKYASATPAALQLPLWFIEGLAEYLSVGSVDSFTAMWMRDATRRNKLPTVKKLSNPRFFPYRYGQSLWAYITGRWGDSTVSGIMKAVSRTGNYENAFQRVLGVSEKELSRDWHESMKERYQPLVKRTNITDSSSRIVIKGTEKNRLNISPSLSPDGNQIVFLSTKDLFSVDMFLANVKTGEIKRKLTKTAIDPHFESLQFIKSSGSWDAEGKQFVFGAISRGQPVLHFVNMETGKKEEEIKFPELDEILNPTWSPDGHRIAFSALSGGWSDIFIFDRNTNKLNIVTNDCFADLHPAWSPDGKFIAFVTERFSSDLNILSTGKYEIGLIDVERKEINKVCGFKDAKSTNPQWAPDSRSLYFLSDRNGISNIFRIDLETQKIYQVTDLYTGASGISALSPGISVAQQTERIAYSLYEEDSYSIYSMDSPEALRGSEMLSQFESINPSVLPPRKKPEGELLGLLKNPLYGLPKKTEWNVDNYEPKLVLDYVSPSQLGVGTDRFGTYVGGGTSLFFSDMLGYHSLSAMFQVSSRLEDLTALAGYQNSQSRWNWGAVVQRIPYVTGGFSSGIDVVFGEPAIIEKEYIFRQINYQLQGFLAYPFNQARRFEISAGYRFIDFDQEVRTRAISFYTGREIFNEKEELPVPPGLHFAFSSAALVYDTSFFGATGPILGQSYRFEASPFLGTISFYTFLADFRRYIMPVKPFTLAFRFLHYGRYGKDAEDSRLFPLYIGYEGLVRGYNLGSFRAVECGPGDECFDFDTLFGSKLIVANLELRFPLFGVLGIGRGYYGILPVDFAAFSDAGIAWSNSEEAWFLGGDRKPVYSAGVGIRMNLFGFAVIGLNYVYPFSRPGKGPYFQFSFYPGF